MSSTKKFSICLFELDEWSGKVLKYHLELNPEFIVEVFNSYTRFKKSKIKNWDLIAISIPSFKTDIRSLISKLRKEYYSIPYLAIKGQNKDSEQEKLRKMGINYFLDEDETTKEKLWQTVIDIKNTFHEKELYKSTDNTKTNIEIIGESEEVGKVLDLIKKVSNSSINVYITGETGTGKELVAKKLHYSGYRKMGNLVSLNMSAIPHNLIESELFGYEKGAFTGAIKRKIGKFELANRGTIFLDEIAEIPLDFQKKLLRVLEEKRITRVGGNDYIELDVRFICASHKKLSEEVKRGTFREDLFYRLMGVKIELPPLRERVEDIPLLINHFIKNSLENNNTSDYFITEGAIQKMCSHKFKGNIRELKSIIDLAIVLSNNFIIEEDNIIFYELEDREKVKEVEYTTDRTLKEHTLEIIKTYLIKYRNNVGMTSKALGIGKSTIYNLIKRYDI